MVELNLPNILTKIFNRMVKYLYLSIYQSFSRIFEISKRLFLYKNLEKIRTARCQNEFKSD